ncbi:MAG: hypothetical protein NTZ49_03805 [Candidatus Parcubacteria bacterium]|nr:hypothetical protein [Candidatus Parcubacteria bacterium]
MYKSSIQNLLFVVSLLLILSGCSSTGDSYDSVDYSSDENTFYGYECTDDCSGHEAGYDWAEEKGIDDVDDCSGKSQSFIEGCQAYVEENY